MKASSCAKNKQKAKENFQPVRGGDSNLLLHVETRNCKTCTKYKSDQAETRVEVEVVHKETLAALSTKKEILPKFSIGRWETRGKGRTLTVIG